ncbi:MAG: hypothetical protein M3389_10355, partial [Actinomycetota bacterium]|nr:hypothetical protein [Actinomycetota bacterium]
IRGSVTTPVVVLVLRRLVCRFGVTGRTRLVGCAVAALVAAAAAMGCGDDSPGSSSAPAGLPTKQFQLAHDLCPAARAAASAAVRRRRATARRQLERLVEAYRQDAGATVRTSFEPANEAGPKFERLTIRQLAQRQLQGASEVVELGGDPAARRCARDLRDRLRALLRE